MYIHIHMYFYIYTYTYAYTYIIWLYDMIERIYIQPKWHHLTNFVHDHSMTFFESAQAEAAGNLARPGRRGNGRWWSHWRDRHLETAWIFRVFTGWHVDFWMKKSNFGGQFIIRCYITTNISIPCFYVTSMSSWLTWRNWWEGQDLTKKN